MQTTWERVSQGATGCFVMGILRGPLVEVRCETASNVTYTSLPEHGGQAVNSSAPGRLVVRPQRNVFVFLCGGGEVVEFVAPVHIHHHLAADGAHGMIQVRVLIGALSHLPARKRMRSAVRLRGWRRQQLG
eukprot:9286749-Pyramimonas_sp.AAC.1